MLVTLVYNPNAGSGTYALEDLESILRRFGYKVTSFTAHDLQSENVFERPTDLMVVAGGDGTVKKVATSLTDRHTPIAILPLGTANNIACSLGILGEPESIVRRWREGSVRPYDIGQAAGPWGTVPFVEAVGVGALAATLRVERKAHETRTARLQAGRQEFADLLRTAERLEAVVTIDGVPMLGDWLLIEVLNLSHTGPCMPLAPLADPGDGALDVLCIREDQRQQMLDWLDACDGAPMPVEPIRASRVAFNWDKRHCLRLDDDLIEGSPNGRPRPVTINLQPAPLSFLLPGDELEARPLMPAREPVVAR